MIRPLVKICGITNYDDADISVSCGADILGFIFYDKSPRYVEPLIVKDIIDKIKDNYNNAVRFTGVFVNPVRNFVDYIIKTADLDIIQFHGDETMDFIDNFKDKIRIKALRVRTQEDVLRSNDYNVDFIMFDAFSEKGYGGTGKSFNWDLISGYEHKNRLFLSGGLNGDNVTDVVKTIKPYAVDLASGVEIEPGKKDHRKVIDFFKIYNVIDFDKI